MRRRAAAAIVALSLSLGTLVLAPVLSLDGLNPAFDHAAYQIAGPLKMGEIGWCENCNGRGEG